MGRGYRESRIEREMSRCGVCDWRIVVGGWLREVSVLLVWGAEDTLAAVLLLVFPQTTLLRFPYRYVLSLCIL